MLFGLDGVAKTWASRCFWCASSIANFPAQEVQNLPGWQNLTLVVTGTKMTDTSGFKRIWGCATLRPVSTSIPLNYDLTCTQMHALLFILLPGTQSECPSESWFLYFGFNFSEKVLGKPFSFFPNGRLVFSSIFARSILILQARPKKSPTPHPQELWISWLRKLMGSKRRSRLAFKTLQVH